MRTVIGAGFFLAPPAEEESPAPAPARLWSEKLDLTSSRATAAGDLQQLPIGGGGGGGSGWGKGRFCGEWRS